MAVRIWKEQVAPLFRQQKGFRNSHLLTDRQADKMMVVGLWDSEAAARGFETSGESKVSLAKFAVLPKGQLQREVFEVSADA